jgi:hypothetical protein
VSDDTIGGKMYIPNDEDTPHPVWFEDNHWGSGLSLTCGWAEPMPIIFKQLEDDLRRST